MRDPHKSAVLVFLLALLAPAAVQLVSPRVQLSVAEKRALDPLPALPTRPGEWSAFSGALDGFLRDHFGLREPLVTGWSLLKYALRYTPGVAVGREGWLYYPQFWRSKYGARTCGTLSAEAASLVARLDRLAASAAASGVPVLFAIAPDKETLYPEHMPTVPGPDVHCDLASEAGAALKRARHLKTVDLNAPLEALKSTEQVYFKTDSHWNDVGGWRVARALLAGTCAAASACAKLPEPSLATKTYSGDLAAFIGLGSVLTERYVSVSVPERKREGRRLYVIGDSFSQSILHFLRAEDSVADVRWWHYGAGRIDFRPLLEARPDALLIVLVERSLYDRELLRQLAAGY
jgi:alginate O-acetyltransferase complex protein AlgJ